MSTNSTKSQLWDIADSLRTLALEIDLVTTVESNLDNDYYAYGTIVKAKPVQTRFKPKSMWVSLGNGKYQHLTGEKGLIAKHSRLSGYTSVVFRP